jgi:hypothetical protein
VDEPFDAEERAFGVMDLEGAVAEQQQAVTRMQFGRFLLPGGARLGLLINLLAPQLFEWFWRIPLRRRLPLLPAGTVLSDAHGILAPHLVGNAAPVNGPREMMMAEKSDAQDVKHFVGPLRARSSSMLGDGDQGSVLPVRSQF